jgi:multidrug efflux pump subunit AcrB
MFKIIAVVVIGVLVGIGFFDIGQEAYTLAAFLLSIGALVDSSQKRSATPVTE